MNNVFRKIINRFYRHKENITINEMLEILQSNKKAILVDVRSSQEYSEGHLPGSINIPVYNIEREAEKMIPNKDNIIIVYCSAGLRSRKALQILKKLEYKNLYQIEGGVENL